MKRKAVLTAAAALIWLAGAAQGVAIGEKIPDLKADRWVGSRKPMAQPSKMMLIEFFHPANPECIDRLAVIDGWAKKYPAALTVAIISREDSPETTAILERVSPPCYAGLDAAGRTFGAFGVQYVPYAVLADPRGRVIWMGNSTRMSEDEIKENIENGIYKDRSLRKTPPAGKSR